MSEKKNYEAIGRYTEALEEATKAAADLHGLLVDLKRLVDRAIAHAGVHRPPFRSIFLPNVDAIREKLDELEEARERLTSLVAEVNSNAEAAGKPKIELVIED